MIGNLRSKKELGSSYLLEEQCRMIWEHLSCAPGNGSDILQVRDSSSCHVHHVAVPGHPRESAMQVAGSLTSALLLSLPGFCAQW